MHPRFDVCLRSQVSAIIRVLGPTFIALCLWSRVPCIKRSWVSGLKFFFGSWVLCPRSHPWVGSQSLVSGLGPNFRVLCLRSRVPPLGSWVSGLGLRQKMGLRSRVRPKILGVGSHYLDMTYSLILFEFFDTVKSCSKELSIQWRPYKLSCYRYKYYALFELKLCPLYWNLTPAFHISTQYIWCWNEHSSFSITVFLVEENQLPSKLPHQLKLLMTWWLFLHFDLKFCDEWYHIILKVQSSIPKND